jgi:predicted ribosome quality control (RQC) complex YloA/Tae2 family protein
METAPQPSRPDQQDRDLARLLAVCRNAAARARRTLAKQQEELTDALREEWYRQIGDSLIANAASYGRGLTASTVVNVHTGRGETVELNPKLDGKANAELFYKRARKARRGRQIIETRIAATGAAAETLEALVLRCELLRNGVPSPEEIADLLGEMVALGLVAPPKAPSVTDSAETAGFRHLTADGFDIYVGKNDEQNDEISTRFARPWDIWLHVAAHAGSHVVIRREKNTPWPPREVLVKAAAVAAWFSKAKHATSAEVHVTEARFVRKRRHAPPGEVIAERCKTIRVAPTNPQDLF